MLHRFSVCTLLYVDSILHKDEQQIHVEQLYKAYHKIIPACSDLTSLN